MTRRRLALVLLAAAMAAVPALGQPGPSEWYERGAVAVSFEYDPEKPVAGELVKFYAVFKGTPQPGTTVVWLFPDGKAVGNPVTHVFETGGYKPVEVQAWQNAEKPLTDSKVLEVTDPRAVMPDEGAVGLFFEVGTLKVYTNEKVLFIASFKGTPAPGSVVSWDFGTASPIYGNPVPYTFTEAGKRLVTVTLEQPGWKSLSYTGYIVVFPQRVERKWR